MKRTITVILNEYETICNEIVEKFAKKQDYSEWYWIGKQVGGAIDFNQSYTFSFDEIVLDMKTKQRKGFIQQWQDDGLEYNQGQEHPRWINYNSYIMGLRYEKL